MSIRHYVERSVSRGMQDSPDIQDGDADLWMTGVQCAKSLGSEWDDLKEHGIDAMLSSINDAYYVSGSMLGVWFIYGNKT